MEELNEMKEQFRTLRETLDNQRIVDDHQIQEAMKSRIHSVNKYYWLGLVGDLIAIPFCTYVLRDLGLSWPFCIATILMLIVEMVESFSTHRGLNPNMLASAPVAETVRKLARLKMRYAKWLRIGMLMMLGWLLWAGWEVYNHPTLPMDEKVVVMVGGVVGMLCGGFVGIKLNRRIQRMADEMLNMLNEE